MGSYDVEWLRMELSAAELAEELSDRELPSHRVLASKLQEAVRAFNSSGVDFVLEHFDAFLAAIVHERKLEWPQLNKAFEYAQRACRQLSGELESALARKELDADERPRLYAVLRMLVYLYVGLMKAKDAKLAAETAASLNIGKRGKKSSDNNDSESEWQENDRRVAVEVLYHLLQLPLHKLWDPPLADDLFVDCVAQPCYRLMEDACIRSKTLRETVFDTLGALNKRYNHGLACTIKLVQTVQMCEHAVAPICAGVEQLVTRWELGGLVARLVRELGEALGGSLAGGGERDGGAGAEHLPAQRNCAQFIGELAQIMPRQMVPAAQAMRCYLENDECYPLRSSVLGMLCEILSQELKGEGLTDEKRTMRDDFLDDLEEHIHDLSAYVRSKVLQYWARLQKEGCVPVTRQQRVLARIIGRLEDKATLVRKSAVQVVKVFIEHNPFSAELSVSHKEQQLAKEKEVLQSLQKRLNLEPDPLLVKQWEQMEAEVKEAVETLLNQPSQTQTQLSLSTLNDSYLAMRKFLLEKQYSEAVAVLRLVERMHPEAKLLRTEMKKDDQVSYVLGVLQHVFVSEITVAVQNDEESLELIKKHEEQENIVAFLEDSCSFGKLIQQAVPLIYTLLMSKQSTDVNEAIDFFTVAHSFNIESANLGTMGMLQLVWSPDQEKRDAVDNAYKLMYLSSDGASERARSANTAQSLVSLVKSINRGQAAALEALLARWLKDGHLSNSVIQIFWEMYTLKHENVSADDSIAALSLLVMISKAKPTIASANLEVIQSVGFKGSYKRKVLSAQLLLAVGKMKQYLPMSNPLFDILKDCLLDTFFNSKDFASFGTTVIDIVYSQCETPDLFCIELMSKITNRIDADFKKEKPNDVSSYPIVYIERIVLLLGNIALQQLIYLDVAVYGELRRRNEVREQRKVGNKKKILLGKNGKVNTSMPLNCSSASAASRLRLANQSAMSCDQTEIEDSEEQGLEGAVADDTDAESVRKVCEEEVVCGGILSRFAPLLHNLLQSNSQMPRQISAAACLTLGRFMLVSSVFCEENMQLLMTLLKNATCSTMRCNIVITLSDLTLRFPNIIQPWTPLIYERLEDPCVEVRQCTVKMLSYLILQEMVRVRGQVAGLARCCVDDDPNTRTMARLFFKQLSQRGNGLYNVIPDIISRLSDPNLALPEEHFRIILKYIMSLIQKDRQMEALVEKLCLRFKLSTDERQWRDLAFCLSLFNYNEKSIKKLIENMDCYKDKLFSKEVHGCFKTIVTNANKMAKADLKATVAELNDKIEEVFQIREGGDEQNKENAPEKCPATPRSRKAAASKRSRARKSQSDSDEDADDDVSTPIKERNNVVRTPRRRGATKKIYDPDSDDSDGDTGGKNNAEEQVFKKPTGKVYRKRKN